MEIEIKLAKKNAKLPSYGRRGDAALDLFVCEATSLSPSEIKMVSTGVFLAIPDGYCGLVLPRSGLASKHAITLINSPGLLDSNYRGEITIPLINHGNEKYEIEEGDRVAQLLIIPCPNIDFKEVKELSSSNRGRSGFGSSGR